jgi:5-methylcytosine-specific restriction endonuclease McrA
MNNFLYTHLTDKEREFLRLAVIRQQKYVDIEKEKGINRRELSEMWESLKKEREELAALLRIWKSKNKKFDELEFEKFLEWTESTPKQCHYCKITETDLNKLWSKNELMTKRARGRKLEMERKEPNEPYSNIDNLVYACYWCNNAKTDTFTHDEFKPIGKVIQQVWEARLK